MNINKKLIETIKGTISKIKFVIALLHCSNKKRTLGL